MNSSIFWDKTPCSPLMARGQYHVNWSGIYCLQSGTWTGFLRVLRLPIPILIPPNVQFPSSVVRGWYNEPFNIRVWRDSVLPYSLSLSSWLCSPLDLGPFFSFLILYTVSRTPWTGDQSLARPLLTHRTTWTQNKRTQTYMPRVGFEPAIPVIEGAKTVHALYRSTTVMSLALL
jgi:hypothetical protein